MFIFLLWILLVTFVLTQTIQKNETSIEDMNLLERVKKADEIAAATTIGPEKMKEVREAEMQKLQEVRNELDRAVQNLNTTQSPSKMVIATPPPSLQTCSPLDCNNRGTCLGTRASFVCFCQIGFSGRSCEETVCDSARDCNGRGVCFGTSLNLSCLCNLGYGGPRCETAF